MEDEIQHLRSKSTELLLREEWTQSIQISTQLISLCRSPIPNPNPNPDLLNKTLAIAYSNRAESQSKLKHIDAALSDCESALKIDNTNFKTLMCKGKILLNLHKYSSASECFKSSLLNSQSNGNTEEINLYLEKCKKLNLVSKTGSIDLSNWVLTSFKNRVPDPELGEYIGNVEIRMSEISGRGLFATKNVDIGAVLIITEAVAVARGFVPELSGSGQIVIWSSFVEKVMTLVSNCSHIRSLVSYLSSGDDESSLKLPEINLYKSDTNFIEAVDVDKNKILSFLDVNSMVEGAIPSKVLGTYNELYGVGLWLLPSYINHSCCPNVRRLHIGDHVIVIASRDIKAGEELTFTYFDVFAPLEKRREILLHTWRFICKCRRCEFEEKMKISDFVTGFSSGIENGNLVFKLEEIMKKLNLKGKEKGFVRASFWSCYVGSYESDLMMKKWGNRIPVKDVIVESLIDAVGSDERILTLVLKAMQGGATAAYGGTAMVEMEKSFKLLKGIYGKTMKRQAMKSLLK